MRTRPRKISVGEAIWQAASCAAAFGSSCDACRRSDRPTRLLPFSAQAAAARAVRRGHVVLCITCATRPAQVQKAIRRATEADEVGDAQ